MINKSLIYIPLGIIVGAVIIILFIKDCKGKNLREDNTLLLNMLQDSLIKIRNKDGSQTAKIGLLQSRNTKLFLQAKTKDSTIAWLQREVRKAKSEIKNGGSVTIIGTSTTFSGTTTTSITSTQPVINGDTIRLYPVYESDSKDTTWIKYHITASKDSINLKFRSKDKFTLVLGEEKVSLFKRKPTVKLTSQNPYTDINSLRTMEVKDTRPIRRLSIGLQIGYGITFKGLTPYAGLGINFKLL